MLCTVVLVVLSTGGVLADLQNARANLALAVMQRDWYTGDGDWIDHDSNPCDWQKANIIHTLSDYMAYTGSLQFDAALDASFAKQDPLFYEQCEFNDDLLWWSNAYGRMSKLYQSRGDHVRRDQYLARAADIFELVYQRAWDDVCGGGVWWRTDKTYKNAITNELLIAAAVVLSDATGNDQYRQIADRTATWFIHSGMINDEHLVNDGLAGDCSPTGDIYTYNQGVLLDGMAALGYSDIAEATAQAAMTHYGGASGVVSETGCGDGRGFKGIFARYLRYLADRLPEASRQPYDAFLERNAAAAWSNARDSQGHFGTSWAGPPNSADAVVQACAADLFNAVRTIDQPCDGRACMHGTCVADACICDSLFTGDACDEAVPWADLFDGEAAVIVTSYGRFVSSGSNQLVYTQPHNLGDEVFTVEAQGGGSKVSLRNNYGRYVTAGSNGQVGTAEHILGDEEFEVLPSGSGFTVAIMTNYGRYISAGSNQSVYTAEHVDHDETFKVVKQQMCEGEKSAPSFKKALLV